MAMNKKRALEILGLNESFTDSELKKAHRQLSREHHPDMFSEASEEVRTYHQERMKEINEARDFFTKFDLDEYKLEAQEEMEFYYRNTTIGDLTLIMIIKALVSNCSSRLIDANSREEVDSIFDQFLEKVKYTYTIYLTNFYWDNYIDESDVKEEINYKLIIGDFYKQACNIRDKYSKMVNFQKRVEQEIATYKLYATCTDSLWLFISEFIVKKAINEAKESRFRNAEEVISNMHKEIKELFHLVDEINSMFGIIEQDFLEINDEALNQEYNNLINDYNAGKNLVSVKQRLTSLSKKIEEYKKVLERMAKIKCYEPFVNRLYANIINSYNTSLLELNPVNDNDKIQDITKLFQDVLGLFLEYGRGLIEYDKLIMLESLSFKDLINDRTVLNVVSGNENLNRERLGIYVKKKEFCNKNLDEECFFVLRCEDGKYFMKKMMAILGTEEEISFDEISLKYISLDELMKSATYQGYSANYLRTIFVDVLYELNVAGDYRYITINNGAINIVKQQDLTEAINFLDYDYNDKEKVRELIEKQIEQSLARNNRR